MNGEQYGENAYWSYGVKGKRITKLQDQMLPTWIQIIYNLTNTFQV